MNKKLKGAWIFVKNFVKTVGVGLAKVLIIGFCAVSLIEKIQDYLKWLDEKSK